MGYALKNKVPRLAVPQEEAAQFLNCSPNHARKLLLLGKLKSLPSSRHKMIMMASILALAGLNCDVLYREIGDWLKTSPTSPEVENAHSEDGRKSA